MRLALTPTFYDATRPGGTTGSRSPTGALTTYGGVNGGGSGGGIGGLVDPGDMVTIPVLPDVEIIETDTEEDVATTTTSPIAQAGPTLISTTSIAEAIFGNGVAVTPDASSQIVRPGPGGTQPTLPSISIPTGPTTYTYKDIVGCVVFNVENKSMNPMPTSVLVSTRIGDVELTRANFQTRMPPLKAKQFRSDFILEGDQSALVKAIKGDLTGNTSFPEAVTVTLDAVIQWHLFRNSVSQTLAVPLETEATF